jgi:hypothetical protein
MAVALGVALAQAIQRTVSARLQVCIAIDSNYLPVCHPSITPGCWQEPQGYHELITEVGRLVANSDVADNQDVRQPCMFMPNCW